jgi:hypothetical protein
MATTAGARMDMAERGVGTSAYFLLLRVVLSMEGQRPSCSIIQECAGHPRACLLEICPSTFSSSANKVINSGQSESQ